MKFLRNLEKPANWIGFAAGFCVFIATVQIFIEVILRFVFNSPTTFGLEMTTYLCAILYTMSGGIALLYGKHVRIDVIFSRFNPRVKAIVDTITVPIFIVGVGGLGYAGLTWTIKAFLDGAKSTSQAAPYIWPVRALIPLGCLLLLVCGITKLIRDIQFIRTKKREPNLVGGGLLK